MNFSVRVVCNPSLETGNNGERKNAGGRTKEPNEISIVYVHQHGGNDVTALYVLSMHKVLPHITTKNQSLLVNFPYLGTFCGSTAPDFMGVFYFSM